MVSWTFLIVFFIVAFLIVGLVLLQEGKGGGLTGMSTGMDGVMGAKNPLRRMTAYLFVFFILMAITINWYFHQKEDTSLPAGAPIAASPQRTLEQELPLPETVVRDGAAEGSLRPDGETSAPVMAIPPEPEAAPAEPAPESVSEEASALRPPPAEAAPAAPTEEAPPAPPAEEKAG